MSKEGLDLADFNISGGLDIPEPPIEEVEDKLEDEEDTLEEPVVDDDKPLEEEVPAESEEDGVEEETPAQEEPTDNVDDDETQEEDNLNLTPLMELVNRDIPVELNLEDYDPTDEESLVAFIKNAIESNSKPTFASNEVEKINEFVNNGGRLDNYFDTMYGEVDYDSINLGEDFNQKMVLKDFLEERYPNKDSNWIDTKIERYENSGILEEEAMEAKAYLVSDQKNRQVMLADKQKTEASEAQARYQAELDQLKQNIFNQNKLLGVDMDKSNKQKFFEFLTKRDKYGKTMYMKKMESIPESSLNMAMLAFQDFDLGSFTRAGEVRSTSKMKKALSRYSDSNMRSGSGSRTQHRSSRTDIKNEFGV